MSNENKPAKPAEAMSAVAYPVGAPGVNLVPEHPDEPKRRKKRARHEAGHAVGIDEYGGETLRINISKTNGKPWNAEPKWPKFDIAEAQTKVFERVITVVAGPVAEKELDEELGIPTRLVSVMVTDGNLDGTDLNYESMDVAQTVHYLGMIKQLTRAQILEAEAEARKMLAKRKGHLNELTKQLEEHHYLEASAIKQALGKAEVVG